MKVLPVLTAAAVSVGVVPAAVHADTGQQVWAQAGCGGCHTLAAAGATGQAGPNLDLLRPSSGAVAAQVTSGGSGMPSFASTLTPAQIQALASWVATSAGGSPAAATGTSAPKAGLAPAAVKRLQQALARLGYFHGPVTGFYGPLTTAAVKRFQHAAGLSVDGIWGPRSAAALARRLH